MKMLKSLMLCMMAHSAISYTAMPKFITDIFEKNLLAVKNYIKAGHDVNVTSSFGGPAIQAAANSGNLEIVNALIEAGAHVDARDKYGQTALMVAARNKDLDIVEALLKAGADVNARDNNGETAFNAAQAILHKCSGFIEVKPNPKITKALEDAGSVSKKAPNPKFITDIVNDDLKAVTDYIKAGGDVNIRSNFGVPAIQVAIGKGNIKIIKALIDAGVDVNAATSNGYTALMSAAMNRKLELVKLLINAGANVNAQAQGGQTALKQANSTGWRMNKDRKKIILKPDLAMIKVLKDAGAIDVPKAPEPKFIKAIMDKDLKAVTQYIAAGGDVNIKSNFGESALELSVSLGWGNIEIAQALIKAGADVNSRDYNGMTPLMQAVMTKNLGAVKALIKAGADVNAESDYGTTALKAVKNGLNFRRKENAKEAEIQPYLEIINALQAAGAK